MWHALADFVHDQLLDTGWLNMLRDNAAHGRNAGADRLHTLEWSTDFVYDTPHLTGVSGPRFKIRFVRYVVWDQMILAPEYFSYADGGTTITVSAAGLTALAVFEADGSARPMFANYVIHPDSEP